MKKLFLILCLCGAYFPPGAGATNSCSNILMQNEDSAFASILKENILIDQYDPLFRKYQLLEGDGSSNLCGITSLANFVNLKLREENRPLPKDKLIEFIATNSDEFRWQQLDEGNRHFRLKGMFPQDLALLSDYIFKTAKLKLNVSLRHDLLADLEVRPQDLETPSGSIWSLTFIPRSPEMSGENHFVLVTKYESSSHRISFIDPVEPQFLQHGTVSWAPVPGEEGPKARLRLDADAPMRKFLNDQEGFYYVKGIVKFESAP